VDNDIGGGRFSECCNTLVSSAPAVAALAHMAHFHMAHVHMAHMHMAHIQIAHFIYGTCAYMEHFHMAHIWHIYGTYMAHMHALKRTHCEHISTGNQA